MDQNEPGQREGGSQEVVGGDVLSPVIVPTGGPEGRSAQVPGPIRLSNKRLAIAMAVAIASDGVSLVSAFLPPAQLVVDGVTALLLFVILGRRWWLLPAFVAEAIPGVAVLPVWSAVVGSVWLTQGRAAGPRIAPVDPRDVVKHVRGG